MKSALPKSTHDIIKGLELEYKLKKDLKLKNTAVNMSLGMILKLKPTESTE
jgi:hypothetical protein